LKKDATEAMNVSALVEKVALSRPDISIQLLIDGEEKFKTPGDGDLLHTIRAVFGREFASKLIKVYGVADGITVSGYIGRSDNVRKNRNLENIFINGRYVKSLTAQAAIEKAYTSFIATEHFPACALFIEMHPGTVDVNVHPAKLEVKFSDERKIFEAVYYTVKNALEDSEYRPEMTLQNPKKTDYNPLGAFVPIGEDTKGKQISFSSNDSFQLKRSSSANPSPSYSKPHVSDNDRRFDLDRPRSVASNSHFRDSNPISASSQTLTPRESCDVLSKYKNASVQPQEKPCVAQDVNVKHEYRYVGEAFNCYVMIELDNELLIIDKHAAHERIIFEDLKRGRNSDKRVGSQSLILPITVILTSDESAMALEKKSDFEALGFEFNCNEKFPERYLHSYGCGSRISGNFT
jgi:DNA mismatch repair protein MutL